jgi:hypothetical protein
MVVEVVMVEGCLLPLKRESLGLFPRLTSVSPQTASGGCEKTTVGTES